MPKCKTCGKNFHACSACGLDWEWEYEYCSHKCWENSDVYQEEQKELEEARRVLDVLSDEQCLLILRVVSNPALLDQLIDKMYSVKEKEISNT